MVLNLRTSSRLENDNIRLKTLDCLQLAGPSERQLRSGTGSPTLALIWLPQRPGQGVPVAWLPYARTEGGWEGGFVWVFW